jgi:hypothetical protein
VASFGLCKKIEFVYVYDEVRRHAAELASTFANTVMREEALQPLNLLAEASTGLPITHEEMEKVRIPVRTKHRIRLIRAALTLGAPLRGGWIAIARIRTTDGRRSPWQLDPLAVADPQLKT